MPMGHYDFVYISHEGVTILYTGFSYAHKITRGL